MAKERIPVVVVRPLKIGDVVYRHDGQGAGVVTKNHRDGDRDVRVMWGTDVEENYPVACLDVEVDEDADSSSPSTESK